MTETGLAVKPGMWFKLGSVLDPGKTRRKGALPVQRGTVRPRLAGGNLSKGKPLGFLTAISACFSRTRCCSVSHPDAFGDPFPTCPSPCHPIPCGSCSVGGFRCGCELPAWRVSVAESRRCQYLILTASAPIETHGIENHCCTMSNSSRIPACWREFRFDPGRPLFG